MSQLAYVNGMCNNGYKEINNDECPVNWAKKRGVIYLQKEDMYAMVNKHGCFVHWKHPEETDTVQKRYGEEIKPKVEGYWGEKNSNNWW